MLGLASVLSYILDFKSFFVNIFIFYSYLYADEGIYPETQFVYDLELPRSFEPKANDNEVSDFYLLPIKEVSEIINSFHTIKPKRKKID